jgi:prefoldin subunit 2
LSSGRKYLLTFLCLLTNNSTVIKQLEKLEGDRKCFRLVGGVLVERTVKDVLPALTANRDGVRLVDLMFCPSASDRVVSFCRSNK